MNAYFVICGCVVCYSDLKALCILASGSSQSAVTVSQNNVLWVSVRFGVVRFIEMMALECSVYSQQLSRLLS